MIEAVQQHLRERHLDGWLLYDFHGNNPLARAFLRFSSHKITTRRFFYWIPARGEPVKIVHAIEAKTLADWPGKTEIYSSWQTLISSLKKTLQGVSKAAMEYSPQNAIPYVSLVDAGTVDLVRSMGVEVVSSADFLPHFTAVLTPKQIESQQRAAAALHEIVEAIWQWIATHSPLTEYDVQQKILADFEKRGLITDHAPIVAVNAHSADPHYEPLPERSSPIRNGDWILIDLWAKEKQEGAVFGDITRVGVLSEKPTAEQQKIFSLVRKAQESAIHLVKSRFAAKKRVEGWEVDESARSLIREAGYGDFFTHRTGHSIEIVLHGSGAHMDNLEMHDVRPLLAGTCSSIEPGIYLPGQFGVRLESDLLIHLDGRVEITGGIQEEIQTLILI